MKNMAAMQAAKSKKSEVYTVAKGELLVRVVDTGTIDAVNSVEVKSRVSGRLSRLLVEEGDLVHQGQVIAHIDPQETEFAVAQNRAQLKGAQSGAARTTIEIQQRRVTAEADLKQAQSRLRRLELEVATQPRLTSAAIQEATAEYNRSVQQRENLARIDQPNARSRAMTAQRDANVNFENARRERERQENLLREGFVSVRDVDAARLNEQVAKLKLDQATDELGRIDREFALQTAQANEAVKASEAALQRARANTIQDRVKREEYLQAVSDVAKAKAALSDVAGLQRTREQNLASVAQLSSVLQDSQRLLRETQIKSPITGVVTKKMLKEGELATGLSGFSAGTPIVRIEDRNALRVLLNVNEIDVAKMREGMRAEIAVDAIPNEMFGAFVKRIAPTSIAAQPGQAITDAVVKYEVELRLDRNDPRLRSGMSAKCSLDVIRHPNVIVVPKSFIAKEGNQTFVEIAPSAPGAKSTRQKVRVVAESGSQYEVEGVAVGTKLVPPKFAGPQRKGMMEVSTDD